MDWFTGNAGTAKDIRPFDGDDEGRETDVDWLSRVSSWLNQQAKMQRGRTVLWSAVGLASGLVVYFALTTEPAHAATLMMLVMAIGLLVCSRLGMVGGAGTFLAFILAGFVIGQAGTIATATKILPASTGKVTISGWIDGVSSGAGKRGRIVLSVDEIPEVKPEYWPDKVRLSIAAKDLGQHKRGDYVRFGAWLYPPLTPATPGGWNYGRVAWFNGVGAGGRITGAVMKPGTKADRKSAFDGVSELRQKIATRIRANLPEREAGFAIALITGERTGINKEMRQALQLSGLAHILAISGLHMSLVAGGVFWLVRALLAIWPAVALRFPIKKLAALSGLLAAGFYLLISGQAIATQRAFIMLSVMFVAVLLGRSAISMRNLAVAAIIVLFIAPHAVLTPSFQMSFLAVMGLIAGYELIRGWQAALRGRLSSRSRMLQLGSKLLLGLLALSATTIIASAFTTLPAAYHFNRFAVWSLPANILAMPFVTVLVMPGAVAGVSLMPLGLEYWPLQVMKLGLEAVEAVATMVSGWPGSATVVGAMEPVLAFFAIMGLCGLCLWRGSLRWVWGAASIGLGCLAIWYGPRPDVLVERSAATMAARAEAGLLVPVYSGRGKFAVGRWLLADGDAAELQIAGKRPGWICAQDLCRTQVKGKSVIWLGRKAKVPADCGSADIVVSANPLRRSCGYPKKGQVHIDRFDVWRSGSHALYVKPDGQILTYSARTLSGERPWVYTPVSRRKVLVKAPPPWKPKPGKATAQ